MENRKLLDFREIVSGEQWELFARDFFVSQKFVIESAPGRGADGGKDLLISEQQTGIIGSNKFTWLVSCKHYAQSEKSVGVSDEANIVERVKQHKADGFLGFYSTLASSSLIDRLKSLGESKDIRDYKIFDSRMIENQFVYDELSKIALRYFPKGYARLKPIQKITDKYIPITCEKCGIDLLQGSVVKQYSGNILFAQEVKQSKKYLSLHTVCKERCTDRMDETIDRRGLTSSWEDISDLVNPISYLQYVMKSMNMLRDDKTEVSNKFHEENQDLIIALSQRTLREITTEENDRFMDLQAL